MRGSIILSAGTSETFGESEPVSEASIASQDVKTPDTSREYAHTVALRAQNTATSHYPVASGFSACIIGTLKML